MQNNSFRATTHYVLIKEAGELLGGNMLGKTVDQLTTEFRMSQTLNPNVKRPVYHFTLSLPHSECLNNFQWLELTRSYAQQMGLALDENQYFVARHHDRQHQHIHIVASRISVLNGRAVETWRDRYRSQAVLRKLEREYGLDSVPCSWEVGKRAMTKAQLEKLRQTGVLPVKQQLQQLIDQAAHDCPTLPELVRRLQDQQVEVHLPLTQTGKIRGISYAVQTPSGKVAIAGCDTGARYSLPGLQKYQGVSYQPARDHARLFSKQNQEQVWGTLELDVLPGKSNKTARLKQMTDIEARVGDKPVPSRLESHNQQERTINISQHLSRKTESGHSQQMPVSKVSLVPKPHRQEISQNREQILSTLVQQAQAQNPIDAQKDRDTVKMYVDRGDQFDQIKDLIKQSSQMVKCWECNDSISVAMVKTNLYVDQLYTEAYEQLIIKQANENDLRETEQSQADRVTNFEHDLT